MAASPEILEIASGLDERLEAVPDAPAVFLIRAREGAPYLARTGLLRRRLRRLLNERERPSRLLNLRGIAERVEYWLTASRLESTLTYYELARQYFPETYVKFLKLRMPPYVKLVLSNPFPRTLITTRLSGGKAVHYGPFSSRAAAEEFERELLDLFQIRRCTEDFEPSPAHPGCIYGEMNLCLRPCQQAVSPEEYAAEANRVVEFLRTGGRSLVEAVSAARDRLSEEMQFEEAARQHKRLEKIQQVLKLRDDLTGDIDRLCGVAVNASVEPNAVELRFFVEGAWQDRLRVGFEVAGGKPAPLDQRLREAVASLRLCRLPVAERQEHLALLARWHSSSWRDGDWIGFEALDRVPYRRLVRAISHVAVQSLKPGAAPAPSVK